VQPVRRRLRPFGLRFELQADDGRVLQAAGAALARFPRLAGGDAELQLVVSTGVDRAGDPAWPVTSTAFSGDGSRLTLRCGSGVLDVDIAAGAATARLPPSLLAIDDAVRMVVEGAFWALAINAGLLRAVHAALVVPGGRGLLLRGPSGAGKSTITYAALRAGAAVASDDWSYAVVGPRPDHLWGYPWRLFLVEEALTSFAELHGREAVLHPGADRVKVAVVPPRSARRRGARLDAVVFLDPASVLDLRPIDAEEARQRFWEPALPTERSGLPVPWVDELLDRPTFVLQRGDDPHRAARALQELARNLW
jgi:hypothetical protein